MTIGISSNQVSLAPLVDNKEYYSFGVVGIQATESFDMEVFDVSMLEFLAIVKKLPKKTAVVVTINQDGILEFVGDDGFVHTIAPKPKTIGFIPSIDRVYEIEVTQKELQAALKSVVHSIAKEDVRVYLKSVLFKIQDGILTIISTDGHRLSIATGIDTHSSINGEYIIPSSSNEILIKSLIAFLDTKGYSSVKIILGEKFITFNLGDTVLSGYLLDARYPDINRVIWTHKHLTTVKTKVMLDICKFILPNLGKHMSIDVQITDSLMTISPVKENKQNDERNARTIQTDVVGTSHYRVNCKYLKEAMEAITADEFTFGFNPIDENSNSDLATGTLLIKTDALKQLVMPMRR